MRASEDTDQLKPPSGGRTQNRLALAAMAAALVAVIGGLNWATKSPSHDRVWAPEFERGAEFHETGQFKFTVKNVRDFEYDANGVTQKAWRSVDIDASKIVEAWFFVEPFEASDLFAHTFVSFVFEDDSGARETLSVTVEARRELDEDYSPLRGVLRGFELSYVWATEKDVATRIAVRLDHPLYAYRINHGSDAARVIFEHFAARTNDIAAHPRFYNTVTSNCTNELFKSVNDAMPKALQANLSWIFTGRAAARLHAEGYLDDPGAPFQEITAAAGVDAYVREFSKLSPDAFSDAWRRRHAEND